MIITILSPLSRFYGDGNEYKFFIRGIKSVGENPQMIVSMTYLIFISIIATAISFITIFLYRKRWVQIRLCIANIVILFGTEIFILYYIIKLNTMFNDISMTYSPIALLPLVSLLFTFMAFRRIAADEALIKSLDRLR